MFHVIIIIIVVVVIIVIIIIIIIKAELTYFVQMSKLRIALLAEHQPFKAEARFNNI
jgi:hypothetical protein